MFPMSVDRKVGIEYDPPTSQRKNMLGINKTEKVSSCHSCEWDQMASHTCH